MAKEEAKATMPMAAAPAAAAIMFPSAMPQLMWRCGYALANMAVWVEPARSASNTITLSWAAPSSRRASPYPCRVAIFFVSAIYTASNPASTAPSSPSAASACSSLGALPCQPT